MTTLKRPTSFAALYLVIGLTAPAAQFKFPNQTFTVPDGFEVALVASTNLVSRPVSGSFDEQGRLYVTDSSGSNEKVDLQLQHPNHRVLRLEDTNRDGTFDKSTVFADKVMFPEGCLWYNGSVYVSAPPSIWKLTDTNNDGVADARSEWHQGKTLTGCANDLHGPYLGPDGWIYWCKGAFAEQTYEVNGKPFKSRAAHIFRARPDHSGLEPVLTGGMDNPVGLAFTADGERILCGTFFAPDEPGHRDGLIHAIYGGVYGKVNGVTDSFKKTGELMPVMTHMGPAAPCSVIRYESRAFGKDYRDNLFCCSFNLHKITRHILVPDGATFKTTDSDFLVSDSADFHPTDVIEDADGSLLVIDTGAWYKICCPTSQLAKPDVLGAIYRIRRVGPPKVADPRGLKIDWTKASPTELAKLLGDERAAVRHRAIQALAKLGDTAVPALEEVLASAPRRSPAKNWSKKDYFDDFNQIEAARKTEWPEGASRRQSALWTLTRIESHAARAAVRLGFKDVDGGVRLVAFQSASLHRDKSAAEVCVPSADILIRLREERLYFELLGRTASFDRSALEHVRSMINTDCLLPSTDRVLQHAFAYGLIESGSVKAARGFLDIAMTEPGIEVAALISLDQMDQGDLKATEVLPLLSSSQKDSKATALWISGHHPEWGDALEGFFRERLTVQQSNEVTRAELKNQLGKFTGSESIQKLIATTVTNTATPPPTRQMLLNTMAHARLKAPPQLWPEAVRAALVEKDDTLVQAAISAAGMLSQMKNDAPDFSLELQRLARDPARSAESRLAALVLLPGGLPAGDSELFEFLCTNLNPAKTVLLRSGAARVLAKSKLNDTQLLLLTDVLKKSGPLEVSKLLGAFESSTNEAVGLRLVAALKESKGLAGVNSGALQMLIAKYPPSVQTNGGALSALLNVDAAKQKEHLNDLVATMPKGDIRRGQAVFNSPKASCSACHAMGYLGGHLGPDLTSIGSARTERDLLESIVYPSASFVRSYEPMTVLTKSDDEYSGVLRKDAPEEIVLANGPFTEVRVARADIAEMRPGRVSVMPAGLDQQLTKQELADLVAFLKNTTWGAH